MKIFETAQNRSRYLVDSVLFSAINLENLASSMEAFFQLRSSNNYVCVSNVHSTIESRWDSRLRQIQNNSFLTIADGQPIIMYGLLSGVTDIERVMGPDIMEEIFASPLCQKRRHYFLGGSPQTLTSMKKTLITKFPQLHIAGMYSPPFRQMTSAEDESMRRNILESKPDYIWVCFGAPKQEYWMKANHNFYPESLLIGIGAGFAYHAGELKRAPRLAQKFALEWIWRLMQDPRRLWKRYFKTNPIFLFLLIKLYAIKQVSKLKILRKR